MTEAGPEFDLIVVGAGPAGLSAALNAAYEGLDTFVLDRDDGFGGQASQATLVENYAGFPGGISGQDLTGRFLDQGYGLGAKYKAHYRVERIERAQDTFTVHDDLDVSFTARAILISCGVDYIQHDAPNLAIWLNRGVHYGTPNLTEPFEDKKVVVVGGANSAGQAAIQLAKAASCKVDLLVRGPDLHKMSMSLTRRVVEANNIEIHTETEIVNAIGENGHLTKLVVNEKGQEHEMPADETFLLIGAFPRTKWLPEQVARDSLGFVLAGRKLEQGVRQRFEDECGRLPMDRETSVPGLYVVGDVRSGSITRVAAAAGDGAIVVPEIFQHLDK